MLLQISQQDQKVNHLQIYLFLWLVISCSCYQLKPPQIFEPYTIGFGDFFNLWLLLLMAELTEKMQQKADENSVNIFNNIRIGKCSKQLQMRKIPIENVHPDVTLLFAENPPKDDYNASKIGL